MRIDPRVLISVACVAAFVTACGGSDKKDDNENNPAVENTAALCSDNLDNDNNGFKDCEDQNCQAFVFCSQTEENKENTLAACQDGIDNDGDTLPDCDDSECSAFTICNQTTPTPETPAVENTVQLCSDNIDNDNNGTKDCDDANCKAFSMCAPAEEGKENTLAACMDKEDNDGDGKTDCDDEECKSFNVCNGQDLSQTGEESTVAACYFDGIDNDGDTLIDCDDPNCKIYTFCQELEPTKENTQTACTDKIDNDDDGYVDCDDPDCAEVAACAKNQIVTVEETQTTCTDGIDNDDDGYVDCDDPGCAGVAACAKENGGNSENTLSKCTDGLDNDGDGDLDCLDADCQAFAICQSQVGVVENTRELCTDGKDNDFNGKTDKDDPNCALFYDGGGQYGENTVTLCGDGKDNDGDGVKDCDDPECQVFDICMTGFDKNKDDCKDDPYKFKKDTCACGETLVGTDCYTNIAKPEDFDKMAKSNGKFILKQNIDFGETDRAPIADFKGILDGNNKRITGVFTQNPTQDAFATHRYYCGLFGATGVDNTKENYFKNIDIAITLNCFNDLKKYENGNKVGNLYAGALAGRLLGGAENITGSSKVYVEDIIEENKEYIFDPKAQDGGKVSVHRQIGGLFGHAEDGKLSHIVLTGNVSAYFPMKKIIGDDSETFTVKLGGVAGTCNEIGDIQTDIYMTLKRSLVNRTLGYYYYGGVCGEVNWQPANKTDRYFAQNVSSRGVIKYLPMETMTSAQGSYYVGSKGLTDIGGIVGSVVNGGVIRNSSFDGVIETNDKKADYYNRSSYDEGLMIGGIVGKMKNDANDGRITGVDSCKSDASIKAVGVYSKIGGIVGSMLKSLFFVRNSSSNLDLELLNSDKNIVDATTYLGGIIGAAATFKVTDPMNQVYIINNSARTNHIQKANGFKPGTDLPARFGGIAGYGGVIVNNFVSDTLTCEGPCNYMPSAVGGAYVYESYWNQDVMGTESGASHFSDASAEAYTFNTAGVPVTHSSKTVLGLLRFNSGHDGGVLAAHIPANIGGIYNNWTTVNDNDDHVIPVPADK